MKIKFSNEDTDSYLDIITNLLFGFVILFMLALLLINVTKNEKTSDVPKKAEYLIMMTWNNDSVCDIDLWLENPRGMIVSYKSKDVDLINLERDDLGMDYDVIQTPTGPVRNNENSEMMTFRQVIPGSYVVNIHAYNCKDSIGQGLPLDTPINVDVRTTIYRLNPSLKEVHVDITKLVRIQQEETVVRFDVDKNNQFQYKGRLYKNLVKK